MISKQLNLSISEQIRGKAKRRLGFTRQFPEAPKLTSGASNDVLDIIHGITFEIAFYV
jgi:hypothetical protein